MPELINLLLPVLMGLITGSIAGCLPGISVLTVVAVLFAWLSHLDLLSLLVFYIACVNSTQYFSSISATVFGIMGDVTSQPAVTHGHRLFQQGQGFPALVWSSTGSFIGAFMGISAFVILLFHGQPLIRFLMRDSVFFWSVLITLAVMIINSGEIWSAVLAAVLGAILGKVGYDSMTGWRFLTMGLEQLDGGVPILPLIMGLLTLPVIIDLIKNHRAVPDADLDCGLKKRLLLLAQLPHAWSVLRGAVIGFFMGFLPGGAASSSNVAASIEERLQTKDKAMSALISAETANNASSISVLIPMLIFAIPLVTSESMILGLAQAQGYVNTSALDFLIQNMPTIFAVFLLVNVINWIICGIYFQAAIKIYRRYQSIIYWSALLICLASLILVAWQQGSIWVYLAILFLGTALSTIIKHESTRFVLIFSFFTVGLLFDHVLRTIT